jgi:hypothetical protein
MRVSLIARKHFLLAEARLYAYARELPFQGYAQWVLWKVRQSYFDAARAHQVEPWIDETV